MAWTSEYGKTYYQRNKERIKARSAAYRESNPEKAKAAVAAWYASEQGKARRREYFKTYAKGDVFKRCAAESRERNKEKIVERGRQWRLNNPDKNNVKGNRYRALKLKRQPSWLTPDDHWMIEEIYQLAQLRSNLTGVQHHVDHIIPLKGRSVSGLHVPTNLQVVTAEHNARKSNSFG